METKHIVVNVVLLTALIAVGGYAWSKGAEVERLDEKLALVSARVEALETGRPAPAVERPRATAEAPAVKREPSPSKPVVAVAPAAVGGEGPAPKVELDPEDPVVRSQLREIIEEERKIEREERSERRAERMEQRTRERIKAIAEKTGMDATTTDRVTDLLLVEQVEAGEVFREARENMDWDGVREKMETLRKETDAQAKDLMDEDEFAEYEAMREEEVRRFMGRGPAPESGRRGRRTEEQ